MVTAVSTSDASTRTASGGTMLASNFETFLTLLTAQLRNQDPLSPVDSNAFTAQLTQMAGVEQQLLTNDLLTSLLAGQQGGGLGTASNYIGKDATAAWSATKLEDGAATWSYELADNASTATVQVLDANGNTVWSGPASDTTEGVHDFTWNGQTTAGGQLSDGGVYTMKVTAVSASGTTVGSQVLTRGRITGVEMYDGVPYLTIGNSIVPLSTVIALDEHVATTTPDPTETETEDAGLLSKVASALNPLNLIS